MMKENIAYSDIQNETSNLINISHTVDIIDSDESSKKLVKII